MEIYKDLSSAASKEFEKLLNTHENIKKFYEGDEDFIKYVKQLASRVLKYENYPDTEEELKEDGHEKVKGLTDDWRKGYWLAPDGYFWNEDRKKKNKAFLKDPENKKKYQKLSRDGKVWDLVTLSREKSLEELEEEFNLLMEPLRAADFLPRFVEYFEFLEPQYLKELEKVSGENKKEEDYRITLEMNF